MKIVVVHFNGGAINEFHNVEYVRFDRHMLILKTVGSNSERSWSMSGIDAVNIT